MKYLVAICLYALISSCQKSGLGTEAIFQKSHLGCTSIEGEELLREISFLIRSDGTWIGWQGHSAWELWESIDEGTPAAIGTWSMANGEYVLALDDSSDNKKLGFLAAWDGAEAYWTEQGWRVVDNNGKEFRFWDPQDYQSHDS